MKRFVARVSGVLMVLLLATGLCACGNAGTHVGMRTEDAYGLGAVSAVRLMGSTLSVKAVGTFASAAQVVGEEKTANATGGDPAAEAGDTAAPEEAQLDKFHAYFAAIDDFLGEDMLTTTVADNTDAAIPYGKVLTIYGKNAAGETVSYSMYYDETLEEDKGDEEDGEAEQKYTLRGQMTMGGKTYTIEGERSHESERDETEDSLRIRAYADASDRNTYVQMCHENEAEDGETEIEYEYTVVSGGKVVEKTAVEFETERKKNKIETEYSIEFRSGDTRGRYEIDREQKGNTTVVVVKFHIDGESGKFTIRETREGDEVRYTYTLSNSGTRTYRIGN